MNNELFFCPYDPCIIHTQCIEFCAKTAVAFECGRRQNESAAILSALRFEKSLNGPFWCATIYSVKFIVVCTAQAQAHCGWCEGASGRNYSIYTKSHSMASIKCVYWANHLSAIARATARTNRDPIRLMGKCCGDVFSFVADFSVWNKIVQLFHRRRRKNSLSLYA